MPKYVEEYQVLDKQGNPVGPKQVFEAETQNELVAKLRTAHQNASSKLYETRLAVKLGTLMEPDPDRPILTFEPRPLSADELVRIDNLRKDPRTAAEANKILLESEFGAPLEDIRRTLRASEENSRIQSMRYEIELFKAAHPEYVECEANKDKLIQFVVKKQWGLTKKNLELAFEELSSEGLLTVQAPAPVVSNEPPPPPTPIVEVAPLPPEVPVAVPMIPETAATVAPQEVTIPPVQAQPAPEPRQLSSSGLGRSNGSTNVPPEKPKVKGITRAEIAKMPSEEYGRRLRTDPEFVKQVEAMLAER